MGELLYNIERIFSEVLKEHNADAYNIPSYQRGYKWTSKEIEQLLKDIDHFDMTAGDDLFYCLQNITLIKNEKLIKNKKVLNVIDGQQRLTTIYILLCYLEEGNLVKSKMEYAVRESTHEFLEEEILNHKIMKDSMEDSITGKISIDKYYIFEAAKTIAIFLDNKSNEEIETFKKKVKTKVKFIVNFPTGSEEKIFSTLNGAKVDLDGADLVRAVIMTRSAKEYFKSNADSENSIHEKRVRIGSELDEMNLWWSQPDVRTFFEQIIPEKIDADIKGKEKFDNKMSPINILYKLFYLTYQNNSKEPFGFRFFEYGIDLNGMPGDNHWELYDNLRKLHLNMQEWFHDTTIYHYIGYLFFNFKRNLDFAAIYDKYESATNKKCFTEYLAHLIVLNLCKEDESNTNDNSIKDTIQQYRKDIKDTSHDWYNDTESLYSILTLTDIIFLTGGEKQRLNVEYFRRLNKNSKDTEDKEHIGPQHPQENQLRDKEAWQQYFDCLDQIGISEENKIYFENLLKNEQSELENEEVDQIVQELCKLGLNSIGNIVLLHQSVNRSYGNDPFTSKRLDILRNYNSGTYIRPYTLYAFMKGFQKKEEEEKNDNNRWTLRDIRDNANHLSELIGNWMQNYQEIK